MPHAFAFFLTNIGFTPRTSIFSVNIAAASAATVQQAGIALGAATAGLVANASGLDNGLDPASVLRAALWVPLALVAAPLAACAVGVRLNLMVPRSPEQGLTAARNG